eukprot:Nitzschia sp. Nitz4//scaffold12_size214221//128194//130007//NITZ4_001509-RA/size214221-augustus-gene-0.30-mRNA-1//-1//CDS//3329535047//5080//frame0
MMRRSNIANKKRTGITVWSIVTHGIVAIICFYLGVLLGMVGNTSDSGSKASVDTHDIEGGKQCPPCPVCPNVSRLRGVDEGAQGQEEPVVQEKEQAKNPFPDSLSNMFVDYATVSREDFNDHLEIGVPLDDTKDGAEDVIIFYPADRTKPEGLDDLQSISASKAVENCGIVKVILTQPFARGGSAQCLAVMPQWESYNIYKFMRIGDSGGLNMKADLRYASRSLNDKGVSIGPPEYRAHIKPSYEALVEYVQGLDHSLGELKPLIEELLHASTNPTSKTIIVQVCNYGQIELFHNYLCSAKARDLDYSHVLMFATDLKTYELCKDLGIPAYYNEAIFGSMPEDAAHGYGDRIFAKMMMAKVYCVHMVLMLGYNVLFQDVDVVWYKNPLPYLESPELEKWDLMFQDDGARSHRYAPYSPNTGFYFVRHSSETLYLFDMLLRDGDNIAKTKSHQAALTVLLNHHATWRGLRIKVWKKGEKNPFPGGVEYHQKKDMMRSIMKHEAAVDPYIFHMSWTKNKDNKKKFFQQMGEWYLKDDCLTGWECCLAEPNVVCHYRDKPSIIPCKDKDPIDPGHPSFW